MKLSESTLDVLKNFASINPSLLLKEGTKQKTINVDKTILAEIDLDDTIPKDSGIYDVSLLLSNLSLLDDPELTFDEKYLTIVDNEGYNMRYFFCSPNHINTPPDKELSIDSPDVTFELKSSTFSKIGRLAAVNSLPNITVSGKGDGLYLKTHERANDLSNSVNIRIGDYKGEPFDVSFKIENLRMIPNDYVVKVNLAGFALFQTQDGKVKYFIALDK